MVEVEEFGVKCSNTECSQIQFLPFECLKCGQKFCIEHVTFGKHRCEDNRDKNFSNVDDSEEGFEEEKGEKVSVNCSMKGCSNIGIMCRKCDKILCSEHIYESEHECIGVSKTRLDKGIQYLKKRYSGGEILSGSKLPESNKSSQMLRKIMIKSKSIGDSSIPVRTRIAIALYVSREVECLKYVNKELPICIWLNGEKTVGWNLDYISERLRVLRGRSNSKLKTQDQSKSSSFGLVLFKNKDVCGNDLLEKKVLEMDVELRRYVSDGESLLLDYEFI